MTQITTDLSNLTNKEICEKINNCLLASTKLNNDCLLSFCSIVTEEFEFDVDRELLFQTCWNIYSWLRQSMKHLIFLKFNIENVIVVDLNKVQLGKLIDSLKEELLVVYSFYPKEYTEVERYLEVFRLMTQE